MPATYEPIASVVLTSSASTVTFANIPQTFTDLVLSVDVLTDSSGSELWVFPNGDFASQNTKFSRTFVYGNGSSALSSRQSTSSNGGYAMSIGWAANSGRCQSVAQFMSYRNPNVFKTWLTAATSFNSNPFVLRQVNLYMDTAPITSLVMALYGGQSYVSGSTFSLFGIKASA